MVGIYCRRSKEADKGRSLENQIEDGIKFAESLGLPPKIYIDKDISGGKRRDKRPDLNNLLNDIEDGLITAVHVSDQDRTARDEMTWHLLVDALKENKVDFYERGILVDLNDDSVLTMRNIKAVLDAEERRKASRKFKRMLLGNAEKGRRFSFIQFGYKEGDDKKLVIDEDKRRWVEDIFRMSLEGVGVQGIANYLNENIKEVPTTYSQLNTGKETYLTRFGKVKKKSESIWRGNTVLGIITNPIYKGWRRWGDNLYPAPAIFEEWYWEKVNDNLKKNSNRKGRKVEHQYLLKGIVKCGKCGNNYYGRTRKDKSDHVYMCSSKRYKNESCGNRSINIDALDALVWSYFVMSGTLLDKVSQGYQNTLLVAKSDKLQKQLDDINRRKGELEFKMKNLMESVMAGVFTHEEAKDAKEEIVKERVKVEYEEGRLSQELDRLRYIDSEIEDVKRTAKRIKRADFKEQKEIINKFIKQIDVLYHESKTQYEITISFKLEDLTPSVFWVDRSYKLARTESGHFESSIMPTKEEQERLSKMTIDEILAEPSKTLDKTKYKRVEPIKVENVDFELKPYIDVYRAKQKKNQTPK